jgi:hypothetical protein
MEEAKIMQSNKYWQIIQWTVGTESKD